MPGCHGLYLHVGPNGTRRWVYRYTNPLTHRVTELGLGTVEAVGLGNARAQARHLQELVARGIDPIQAKRSGMPLAKLATPEPSPTFKDVATKWFEAQAPGWRSESQLRNVALILHGHGGPLASMAMSEITPEHIEAALRTLRTKAPDQARRALRIYFKVFAFSAARGLLPAGKLNPATWEGLHETWWQSGWRMAAAIGV
jgi:hypothetical protein